MNKTHEHAFDPMTKRVLTIEEFCHRYSQGRTKAFEMIATGQLAAVRIGRRRYVRVDSAEALLKAS